MYDMFVQISYNGHFGHMNIVANLLQWVFRSYEYL